MDKMKGQGQCRCSKCGFVFWTCWCYKDKDGKVYCVDCKNEKENPKKKKEKERVLPYHKKTLLFVLSKMGFRKR